MDLDLAGRVVIVTGCPVSGSMSKLSKLTRSPFASAAWTRDVAPSNAAQTVNIRSRPIARLNRPLDSVNLITIITVARAAIAPGATRNRSRYRRIRRNPASDYRGTLGSSAPDRGCV